MPGRSIGARERKLVQTYFRYVKDLYAGKHQVIEKFLELWDPDGTFEFVGTPPTKAAFHGVNAIHVLYKNRLNSSDMPLRLEGAGTWVKSGKVTGLGELNTGMYQTREIGNRIMADWTKVIRTQDRRGFTVSGSHEFTFKDGRIQTLRVVVSPKPHATEHLSLAGLSVNDIGRLSLAAWAVV